MHIYNTFSIILVIAHEKTFFGRDEYESKSLIIIKKNKTLVMSSLIKFKNFNRAHIDSFECLQILRETEQRKCLEQKHHESDG